MSTVQGTGRLSASQQGSDIVITYTGEGPVYVYVDGSGDEPIEVPIDKKGNGRIPVPNGAESVTISDRRYPNPSTVNIDVVQT